MKYHLSFLITYLTQVSFPINLKMRQKGPIPALGDLFHMWWGGTLYN